MLGFALKDIASKVKQEYACLLFRLTSPRRGVGDGRLNASLLNIGQPLTYTISATNKGPLAANGATLNFQSTTALFADTRFSKSTSSQGTWAKRDDNTTACALGTLAATSTTTVTMVITPTVLFPATITNTIQITSTALPPELNWEDNEITQTTQIALPLQYKRVGYSALTEYYDTPQGNFRIRYTRTYPNWFGPDNTGQIVPLDDDSRLLAPDHNIYTPLPLNANGYPEFVVELGASLKTSLATYGQLGYQAAIAQIRREPSSGRYPVFVTSQPIWTDELPFGVSASGITFPNNMYVGRMNQYDTTKPIDWLRSQVAAHELFHTLQWTYIPNPPGDWGLSEDLRWWMEATAEWAQPKVYPLDGTYPRDLNLMLIEKTIRVRMIALHSHSERGEESRLERRDSSPRSE